MSTILDALRKVEENQRTRSADARARLLFFPTRPEGYSSRQRRTPWVIGTGLALAGFAAGAGLILWGPYSHVPEEMQIAKETDSGVVQDKESKPLIQPLAQPLAQAPTASPSTPAPIPAEMPAPAQVTTPQPSNLPPPTPIPAAVPPEARAAPAAPLARSLDAEAEARRSALREARRARRTHGGALPPELQDLAKAARAARAQSRSSPEARGGVPDETPTASGANRVAKTLTPAAAPSSTPPNSSLSFLQWSPEPDRRIAFIKVNGGPLTLAHEGDTVAGFTVVEIRHDAVELSAKGQSFTLQADQ